MKSLSLTKNIFYGKEYEIPNKLPSMSMFICSDITAIYLGREDGTPYKIESGGILDAPFDGLEYIRKNGDWVALELNDGIDGESSYDIWINEGNSGSEDDFLNSLKGDQGEQGLSAYDVAVNNGYTLSESAWIESLNGEDGNSGLDGDSAYDIWLSLGNEGSEADFLEDLEGPTRVSSDSDNSATIGSDGFIFVSDTLKEGLERQILLKNTVTDNDFSWSYGYYDLLINVEYNGTESSITGGTVFECVINSNTIYRFISSETNSNGYPVEDSFYSSFTEGVLTNLMIERG
jgi:hypothetical protein|tara:strand:+ start:567 stop:1436 length:870 start_codon:yes stop_codon:yes gene_type:complete